jgi:DNA-binding NarL/FixJ family response regulator
MSGESLTFLIADDHPMVRDALASALGQAFAGAGVVMAGSLPQVQAALERDPETDALLLDLDMPGMDGLTGLALLRSDHPTVPIIVVSAAREAAVIRRAYEFGASAYIDKSASLEEISATVRAVLDGEIFAPADDTPVDSFAQRAAQLTPQQWRVLALMIQGDQNKQIAFKLGVGEATVKAHVTVILRKLGVRSRTQAVIEARGLNIPPAEPVRPEIPFIPTGAERSEAQRRDLFCCRVRKKRSLDYAALWAAPLGMTTNQTATRPAAGARTRSSARRDAGLTGLCSNST